ncbi:MAG: hypothetical protein HWN67_08660 [Candidatus Helarchaeota archaeon]|nr:hypothetical protein [Candidatus Helarchaeota archaeon]
MKKYLVFIFIIIGSFIFNEKISCSQEDKIVKNENEINTIEKTLFELQGKNRLLIKDSEILAEEINELKVKISKDESIWDRHRLEEKLKQSQELSDEIKSLNRKIENVRNQYRNKLKEVVKLYNEKIKTEVKNMKKTKDENALQKLKELYDKRSEWRAKIEDEIFYSVFLVDVEINPLDGPEELTEKGDILMDIAEDLRRNMEALQKIKEELQEENEIRTEIGEFIEEIYLFEEREKGLVASDLNKSGKSGLRDELYDFKRQSYSNWLNVGEGPGSNFEVEIGRDYLFRLFEEYKMFKEDEFSDESIDDLIQKYSEIISRLKTKFKETKQKAEMFYNKAEELMIIENK